MRNLAHRMLPASEPFYPFPIDYAAKFDGASKLSRSRALTTSTTADDRKKQTVNVSVKRAKLGAYQGIIASYYGGSDYCWLYFETNDTLAVVSYAGGGLIANIATTAVYRDVSQHYNIHLELDATQATASDRVKLWVNGAPVALTGTFPPLNSVDMNTIFQGFDWNIGHYNSSYYTDGYITNLISLDGLVEPVTSFGEFKYNTWVPKRYTGSYGTNGFHLDFSNASDLGEDSSGNGNDFTNSGVEQTTDTPTNNFPTFDPLSASDMAVSEAGLRATSEGGTVNWESRYSTSPIPSSGNWQAEFKAESYASATYLYVGLGEETQDLHQMFCDSIGIGYRPDGKVLQDGSYASPDSAAWTTGDIIGAVVNSNDLEVSFYKNGVLQNTYSLSGLHPLWFAVTGFTSGESVSANFGAEGFDYPITGALPICTANWPASETPVIDSEQGLWVTEYTGTGAAQDITGAAFDVSSKGMTWLKSRVAAYAHQLFDPVRGAGNAIFTNLTSAEAPDATSLTAFLTNGFSLGTNAYINTNTAAFIAWVFNMLPAYGMDIVTYTGNGVAGRTVAHNLGGVPEWMIVKRLDATSNWAVGCEYQSAATPWDKTLLLESTAAVQTSTTMWNQTTPGATSFTVGTNTNVNANGGTYVAYLFRSIPSFLKVGYYIGNGSVDGPRIYTGFRPRYLLGKRVDNTSNWRILDSARNPYNTVDALLQADISNAEGTEAYDFLSNGFKVRNTSLNVDGGRYIYLAIGDPFPFVNAF